MEGQFDSHGREVRNIFRACAALFFVTAGVSPAVGADRVCAPGESETTVMVVRHAEKTCRSCDELSEAGLARAQALPAAVRTIADKLDAVYHSDTKRTKQTVAHLDPKPPTEYARNNEEGKIAAEILENHCGGSALAAGHSTTTLLFLKALGVPPGQIDLDSWFPTKLPSGVREIYHEDYDNLFVVKVCGPCDQRGRRILMHRNYGTITPNSE
ncbi:MAG: phosphoglycerate mutase family protein [Acidobacteria bacterium]|nr:phosphoglycerate mutase family protein [Acidobacteriota bacterium]